MEIKRVDTKNNSTHDEDLKGSLASMSHLQNLSSLTAPLFYPKSNFKSSSILNATQTLQ